MLTSTVIYNSVNFNDDDFNMLISINIIASVDDTFRKFLANVFLMLWEGGREWARHTVAFEFGT